MLAAASKTCFEMRLLKMALSLLATEQPVPTELKSYADEIIIQAKEILLNPEKISVNFHPEAIELAYEIETHKKIQNDIKKIENFDKLTPMVASNLLKHMEHCSAC